MRIIYKKYETEVDVNETVDNQSEVSDNMMEEVEICTIDMEMVVKQSEMTDNQIEEVVKRRINLINQRMGQ